MYPYSKGKKCTDWEGRLTTTIGSPNYAFKLAFDLLKYYASDWIIGFVESCGDTTNINMSFELFCMDYKSFEIMVLGILFELDSKMTLTLIKDGLHISKKW